jgi:hypothetical protein
MSLLGIIETLRRNLKAVVVASCVVLALLVVADVVRLMTASGEHEAAAATEHESPAAVASEHAAPTAEHAAPAHGETAVASHGFWATSYHIAENVPAFWTLFGFLGCVVLVVVSKSYGHFGVSKREDYYSE